MEKDLEKIKRLLSELENNTDKLITREGACDNELQDEPGNIMYHNESPYEMYGAEDTNDEGLKKVFEELECELSAYCNSVSVRFDKDYRRLVQETGIRIVAGEQDSFGWLTALAETKILDKNSNMIILFIM